MDKFGSQSKNKNRPRGSELGKVTSLPLHKQPASGSGEKQVDLEKISDDELRKDLELLARMREQIEQLPDIDAARIVQIHEKILRGEYKVDSKSLAGKLGKFEADFQDPSSS